VRVRFAVLARYAEVDPESGLLNLTGAGLDVFGFPDLPQELTVGFALQLGFTENEVGQSHEVTLVTRGPDTQVVGVPTSDSVSPTLGEYHAPGWEGVYAVAGVVHLLVEEPGTHSLSILIEGQESGYIPFQVVLDED
jgi:hypothetical protein